MEKLRVSERDILAAAKAELKLATSKLMIPGERPPYFVSYLLRQRQTFEVWARFGSIYGQKENQGLDCYCEVRVGDYNLDQSIDGGLNNFHSEESNFWADNHPLDGDRDVLRYSLRLLTEDKYREALEGYYKKKSVLVGGGGYTRKKEPNFYRARPVKHREKPKKFHADLKDWADLIVPLSRRFRKFPFLRSSFVEVSGEHARIYYQNSEGSDVITDEVFYTLELHALAIDERGYLLKRQRMFHFIDEKTLPTTAELEEGLEELAREVDQLRKAPVIRPHHGPVLLGPIASGVFIHEVLGHRLEGDRLLAEGEGQTLKDKIGEQIAPEFISLYDDPSLSHFKGTPLLGHYRFDSEGTRSRRVELIKNGVLKNFLTSRTPTHAKDRSNGHGRTELFFPPMTRMGNLILQAQGGKSRGELEDMLMKEIRDTGKGFGLIIDEVGSGETETSNYDFQVFKGVPEKIFRVDGKTGRKTLVRGLDFIGTPLSAVNQIIAAGSDTGVFNSWCTAESGDVRVATLAPSLLIADLELQRGGEKKGPKTILPTYWSKVSL